MFTLGSKLGGWDLVYFLLDIVITFIIVRIIVSRNERRRWFRARENHARSLKRHIQNIVTALERDIDLFRPFRDELTAPRREPKQTHYELGTGAALRTFQRKFSRLLRDARRAVEFGNVGSDADLSAVLSEYASALQDLDELIHDLVESDPSANPRGDAPERRMTADGHTSEPVERSGGTPQSSPVTRLVHQLKAFRQNAEIDRGEPSLIPFMPRRRRDNHQLSADADLRSLHERSSSLDEKIGRISRYAIATSEEGPQGDRAAQVLSRSEDDEG
jgi:hypothetical protein